MELTQAQKIIALDPHRFRVLCCGRRFGKTTLALDQIKARAAIPNSRIAYVAPTYQQARDIAWEELKRDCLQVSASINESRLEIKLVNGTNIALRGWESVETLRGQRFDLVVLDEIAMMRNFWLNWQEVIRPTLTDTRGEVLFISTPKGFNHFYDLYNLQETDKDFASFHFTSYDNPHIPVDEIDKARNQLTADRFAQEYMADFRKASGLVYKEFDRERHVFNELTKYRAERVLGVDFGYTNPTAILTIDRDHDSTYWITEEWYKTGKTNIDVIEYSKSKSPNAVYPDPAEPDRIEEMRRHGLNVREVSKEIEAGIDKVRELFKANRIKIHSSCVNLISELETYSYPEKKPEKNEPEVPIKEHDHACDALRYALFMNSGGKESTGSSSSYRPKIREFN